MMLRYLLLFLIASILLPGSMLKAQSTDHQRFLDDLNKLALGLNSRDKQKEAQTAVDEFAAWFESAPVSDSVQGQIIKVSRSMLDRKMPFDPQVLQFLAGLVAFPFGEMDETDLGHWLRFLQATLGSRQARNAAEYAEAGRDFFTGRLLYASRSLSWMVRDAASISMVFDTSMRILVQNADLVGMVRGDTSVISGTSGSYDPVSKQWKGLGGTITWERAGLPASEVFATLAAYEISLRSTDYTVDSVSFTHKAYFKRPLLGQLEEKLMMEITPERVSYPRFRSYFSELEIRDLFKGIDYYGGVAMVGNRLEGSGTRQVPALLDFRKDNKVFLRLRSPSFVIRQDRMSSARAEVSIYHEGDSIYHPGLSMRYFDDRRELSLMRGDDGLSQSPYMNTYHNIDMYFEALYWKLDESEINLQSMKGLNSEGRAIFESSDYYSLARYEKLQGIDEVNPLDLINSYCRRYGIQEFYLEDYVSFVRKPPEQVKAVLLRLANAGFITYDLERDRIRVKDRLSRYLQARSGRMDHDVITFQSTITALPNASLSLLDFDLRLRGVPFVYLSDSQNVVIIPENQEIVMKKDRDFLFSGVVRAGNFHFQTKGSAFDYETFRISMPTIDSMRFRVRSFTPDNNGFYTWMPVQTALQDLSGELLIDYPKNKSGKDPHPEYPIFKCGTEAFVYYDQPSIYGGVYERERFYYRIDPFTIDSLDNFSTNALSFAGYLNSAGIFPDIHMPLKVQPDYSLGFVTQTPISGYPIYGGKGKYSNVIDLSNKGLRGRGELHYLNATAHSQEFLFFPDSSEAMLSTLDMESVSKGVMYPDVQGEQVAMTWLPYEDHMMLTTTSRPMQMYAREARLDGMLRLSPLGLNGKGSMQFDKAVMESDGYSFMHREFTADTADFRLNSYDLNELAFSITNYQAHINLETRQGKFLSNGGLAQVAFPLNDYISFMDECTWLMDKDQIALRNTRVKRPDLEGLDYPALVDADITGSEFVSTHKAQDSLRFYADRGVFDLKENVITAEGVYHMRVADAAIYPAGRKVTIYRQAEMGTLSDAVILADVNTRYHLITQATVNVHGRQQYAASGKYLYAAAGNEAEVVHLHTIGVAESKTYGKGDIAEADSFYLNPAFAFQGKVNLDAPSPHLTFSGGFRISQDCDSIQHPWVRFESPVDPADVSLPLEAQLKDINNKPVQLGVLYSSTEAGMYPAFLRNRLNYSDETVMTAGGAITYNKEKQSYQAGPLQRLKGEDEAGNYVEYNKRNCVLTGEGEVRINADLPQVSSFGYGQIKHLVIPDSTMAEVAFFMDFFFSQAALQEMARDLEVANLAAGDPQEGWYPGALQSLLGQEEATDVLRELSMYGTLRKTPQPLQQAVILSKVEMDWKEGERMWVSRGNIGLAAVGGKQLNREIPGMLVIERKRSGDILTLYLEAGPKSWYYFNYTRGLMQAISSNEAFNTVIREEKPEKRTMDTKKGEQTFRYIISTERKRRDFVIRYYQQEETE